jgi:hypothetical protein
MGAGVIASIGNLLRAHAGLLTLLLATFLLRGGLMIARFDQLKQDDDDYLLIAHNIVRFATFSIGDPTHVGMYGGEPGPSAYRPPLYPVLLSNLAIGEEKIIFWESIALLHLALGVMTVWLTWLVARALGLGWASYAAGLLVACDPILLNQQSLVMTETLAAACTVLAWGLLVRFHFDRNWWNAALAGGAIGLAALCRPTFLPWLAVSAVMALSLQPGRFVINTGSGLRRQPSQQWGQRLINALALIIGGLSVISPWLIRNYQAFQRPLLTTTHGGYTLYLANNPHFYRYLRSSGNGLPWDPRTVTKSTTGLGVQSSFRSDNRSLVQSIATGGQRHEDEFAIDRAQAQAAREAIQADPGGFLLAAWFRVRQLWTPLPYQLSHDESFSRLMLRYLTAGWYVALYGLALVAAFGMRGELLRSPWVWGLALCLIFTAVHTLYWCNLRMRAPLVPIVAMVAAAGLASLPSARGTGMWHGKGRDSSQLPPVTSPSQCTTDS